MTTQEILNSIFSAARRRTPPADDAAAQQADTMARANLGESSGIPAPPVEMIEGAGRALAESWMRSSQAALGHGASGSGLHEGGGVWPINDALWGAGDDPGNWNPADQERHGLLGAGPAPAASAG